MSFLDVAGEALGAVLNARARVALPYITAAVHRGLSANETLRTLSAAGMGIRRSNLLTIARVIRAGFETANTIRGLKGGEFPSPTLFTPATYPTQRRYSFQYSVSGINEQTGENVVRYVTITSDRLLTLDELNGAAEFAVNSNPEAYGIMVSDVNLETALVNPLLLPQ